MGECERVMVRAFRDTISSLGGRTASSPLLARVPSYPRAVKAERAEEAGWSGEER